MQLEQRYRSVDFLSQVQPFSQLKKRSDSTGGDRLLFIGQFILDAFWPNHWRSAGPVSFIDTPQHFSLACFGLASYFSVHSKPSFAYVA